MKTSALRRFAAAPLRQDYRDANGAPIAPPKGRSYASIRSGVRRSVAAHSCAPTQSGRYGYEKRAFQYVQALRGIETGHSCDPSRSSASFTWDVAADGSKRVRMVRVDGKSFKIPNWDFIATVEELEAQGAFA